MTVSPSSAESHFSFEFPRCSAWSLPTLIRVWCWCPAVPSARQVVQGSPSLFTDQSQNPPECCQRAFSTHWFAFACRGGGGGAGGMGRVWALGWKDGQGRDYGVFLSVEIKQNIFIVSVPPTPSFCRIFPRMHQRPVQPHHLNLHFCNLHEVIGAWRRVTVAGARMHACVFVCPGMCSDIWQAKQRTCPNNRNHMTGKSPPLIHGNNNLHLNYLEACVAQKCVGMRRNDCDCRHWQCVVTHTAAEQWRVDCGELLE